MRPPDIERSGYGSHEEAPRRAGRRDEIDPCTTANEVANVRICRIALLPLAGRPFRAENGCVAVWVTSILLWSFEAVE